MVHDSYCAEEDEDIIQDPTTKNASPEVYSSKRSQCCKAEESEDDCIKGRDRDRYKNLWGIDKYVHCRLAS